MDLNWFAEIRTLDEKRHLFQIRKHFRILHYNALQFCQILVNVSLLMYYNEFII